MSIENNAAACDMLRRLLADTENKIRSAYNYGFKDGTEQGRAEAIESIVKYSMEKYAEDDNPNGTSGMTEEEIIRCGDCKHYREYEPNAKHDGWCSLDRVTDVNKEDFCSKAERKEK